MNGAPGAWATGDCAAPGGAWDAAVNAAAGNGGRFTSGSLTVATGIGSMSDMSANGFAADGPGAIGLVANGLVANGLVANGPAPGVPPMASDTGMTKRWLPLPITLRLACKLSPGRFGTLGTLTVMVALRPFSFARSTCNQACSQVACA
ncbi:MAG: hypothetical protein FJ271_11275 [Planctomycetes bacterium]|nr:hypothetical protein [Planctomycetota bacterium]